MNHFFISEDCMSNINVLVTAMAHFKEVDPALVVLNESNTCRKIHKAFHDKRNMLSYFTPIGSFSVRIFMVGSLPPNAHE